MKENKILIIYFVMKITFLFTSCYGEDLKNFQNNYSEKGDKLINYFYTNIIKNKNYHLLKDIILKEFNMYDPEDSECIYWVGDSDEDTINWIINKNIKYGKFIKYEIKEKRFFYAMDDDTFNIDYTIEVKYAKATAKEIIILGFFKKGPHELKLIAYSSRIKNK